VPIAGSRGRPSGARQPVEKREVPRLRTVPLPLVLFFWCTSAGALVARGWAHAGRFSLHAIPGTCALSVSAMERRAQRKQRAQEERTIIYS